MINRQAIGTLLLAAVVIIGTSAGSGGCGGSATQVGAGGEQSAPKEESHPQGDRGVSAPLVGAGGESSASKEESEPSKEASSGEKTTPNPSHDAQPRKTGATGASDPCVRVFRSRQDPSKPFAVGKTLKTYLTITCLDEPKQYGGTVTLAHSTNPPTVWTPEATQSVYTHGGDAEVTAPCKDGLWVAAFDSSGRDHDGHSFTDTYSSPPQEIDCP